MRRLIIIPLLFLMFLSMGCEKRKFFFNVPVKIDTVFEVDQTGPFMLTETITEAEVNSALDLPDGAQITELDIQALSIKVNVKPGNEAISLSVSGSSYDNVTNKQQLFSGYFVPVAAPNAPFIGINALLAAGVNKIKTKLEGFAKNIDNTNLTVEISGSVSSGGQRILADIHLLISANVKYAECIDVAKFMGGGEACDLE